MTSSNISGAPAPPAPSPPPPAPPGAPEGAPERAMRLSVVEGALSAMNGRVVAGPLVTSLALLLGAREFDLGLLAAATALAPAGGLVAALTLHRFRGRRRFTATCVGLGRALWAAAALALFLEHETARMALFLLAVFAGGVVNHMGVTAWQSWMTDLVPPERRGRYFGFRNAVLGAVDMATAYGTGFAYDRLKTAGHETPALAALFLFAGLAGLAAGWVMSRQWDPPGPLERAGSMRNKLALPFREPAFRRLLLFGVGWSAAIGVASPFYVAHMIRNLQMPMATIAWYSILAGSASLLVQPIWGRVTDRYGNRPVLVSTMCGVVGLPLLWLPATAGHLGLIWFDAILTGIVYPGFNLALFNLLLGTAPPENRTAYLAAYNLGTGLAAFTTGLLGGWLAGMCSEWHGQVGPLMLVNFHLLFILTTLGRLILLPLALRLREDRAAPVGALVEAVGDRLTEAFTDTVRAGIEIVRRATRR
jgi:MFS family permease